MFTKLLTALLLAHLISDFALQTDKSCKKKLIYKICSIELYIHSAIVTILSLIAIWDRSLYAAAIFLGLSHLIIDIFKSYCKKDNLYSFVIDQALHIVIIILCAQVCIYKYEWVAPEWYSTDILKCLTYATAFILSWKPANLIIKHILSQNSINIKRSDITGQTLNEEFRAGALIGTIERWLIIIFILLGSYEAVGFLLAAKSIIRFKETDTSKTEYVLTGTLLSVFIAVISAIICKALLV